MDYTGTIIKESLADDGILQDLTIIETEIETVTEHHKTPWVKQWTKIKFLIPETWAEFYAQKISEALDADHAWYVDFKNDQFHYIIFYGRFFMVDLGQPKDYQAVKEYGLEQGMPDYQLDFI
ncbi:MAG: hypothetical protein WCW26_00330 [Candidatus Buchananbacteria bacterium]